MLKMKHVHAASLELALLEGDEFNDARHKILKREIKRLRGMGHDEAEAQFFADRLLSAAIAGAIELDNVSAENASTELGALGFSVDATD